jgi:hypothetical protein
MATVARKMKVKALDGSEHEAIYVWCPGCNTIHAFDLPSLSDWLTDDGD